MAMKILEKVKHQLQTLKLAYRIMRLVLAADGAMDGNVGRLAKASSDAYSFQLMVEFLSRYPQAKLAFQERPRLGKVDLQQLHQLPKNTLGYAFADHMIKNNLTFLQPGEVNNDYTYLAAHITETHDIWHVVTGSDINITGEIRIEAFSVAQLYASRFWIALLAKNLLKVALFNIERSGEYMDAIAQGWVMGIQAKPLFGIQWDTLWETPLEDVRSSLNIPADLGVATNTIVEPTLR